MALTARKIINAQTVYTFLENSFSQVYNSLKQQGLLDNQSIQYTIHKEQADFDGSINVPTYADDDNSKMVDHGLVRFIAGQVDPSKLSNVFSQSYSFEMLAFESHREDIRKIFTSMASTINGNTFSFSDETGEYVAFAQVDEFPPMSQTIDANGADKFIISLVFSFLFRQNAVHYTDVYMSINGIRPEFDSISFTRQSTDMVVDLKKSYENRYVPSRSNFNIAISGFYVGNEATDEFIRWLMDEEKLEDTLRFFYSDGRQIKSGEYLINEVKLSVPFEAILQYNLSLIPYKDAQRTHRGLYVKNALGTGDKLIGSQVTLAADSELNGVAFSGWSLEYTSDPAVSEESIFGDTAAENQTFTMPNADLIVKANYEE